MPRGALVALAALRACAPAVAFGAEPPVVTFEGQVRLRYEYRAPLDYRLPGSGGRAATDGLGDRGDFAHLRSRLAVKAVLPSRATLFLQVQDARVMGVEPSTLASTDNVDAHQAYARVDSLAGAPLALQIGRFEMAYGDARLIGPGDWGPNGRSFDGGRLEWRPGAWRVDAFATWLGEGRKSGRDRLFGGVVAGVSRTAPEAGTSLDLDLMAFARDLGDTGFVAESGIKGNLQDRTFGARLRVAWLRAELRLEGATQTGDRAGDEVRAWGFAARADLVATREPRVRLYAEYAAASGDERVGDGEWGRFDPLYPTAHGLLGYSDLAAWSNVADLNGGVALGPHRGWSFEAALHRLALEQPGDGWIADNGDLLRRDVTGASGDEVGFELDLTARWAMRPGVTLQGGLSRFAAGDFVSNTGGGGSQDWVYLQTSVGF